MPRTIQQQLQLIERSRLISLRYATGLRDNHPEKLIALTILTGTSLEKAAQFAVMSDTLPENARHTSLLVNNLEYGPFNTIKNYDFTDCKELYDKMQADRYNATRDDKRFIAVLEKIGRYC